MSIETLKKKYTINLKMKKRISKDSDNETFLNENNLGYTRKFDSQKTSSPDMNRLTHANSLARESDIMYNALLYPLRLQRVKQRLTDEELILQQRSKLSISPSTKLPKVLQSPTVHYADYDLVYGDTSSGDQAISGSTSITDNRRNVENHWLSNSSFEGLTHKIVPLRPVAVYLAHNEFKKNVKRLQSTQETPYTEGDNFFDYKAALSRRVTKNAFMITRLASFRKTPTRVVIPKLSESQVTLDSSRWSDYQLTGGVETIDRLRVDEMQVNEPRFDPLHARCGMQCRRCYFLSEILHPPHLLVKDFYHLKRSFQKAEKPINVIKLMNRVISL